MTPWFLYQMWPPVLQEFTGDNTINLLIDIQHQLCQKCYFSLQYKIRLTSGRKGAIYPNDVNFNAVFGENSILHKTQRERTVRAKEKPGDKNRATSFLFFWPFSQFQWSKSSFPGSLMLSWQNIKQIFSLHICLVLLLNIHISQIYFFFRFMLFKF